MGRLTDALRTGRNANRRYQQAVQQMGERVEDKLLHAGEPAPTARQVVRTVRGHDGDLQAEIRWMAKHGYEVDSINGRKAAFSATAGVFTRKQVWTVVFQRTAS